MKEIVTTLLMPRKDNKILLALKKKGFGAGKYNGLGGKLEDGETPEMAMIRESYEEGMITPTVYEKMGIMEFNEFIKGEKVHMIFHLYIALAWDGEPTETEEMKPEWFDIDKIPYDNMFTVDKYWLPLVLQGKKIKGNFEFDEEWNLIYKDIKEI